MSLRARLNHISNISFERLKAHFIEFAKNTIMEIDLIGDEIIRESGRLTPSEKKHFQKVYDMHIIIPMLTHKNHISIWVKGKILYVCAKERIRQDVFNGYTYVEHYILQSSTREFKLPKGINVRHLEAYYRTGELHILGDEAIFHPAKYITVQ
ncbi:Hsp20/alpha crystallin family protein [Sediminitomix flava]|uniref:Uncharacterized protein n=1 Tax=Sediminitomix flava TaxID=379075 RepID=A0A315Z5V0_SEDFL|nr:Hsp20/alpha crystallin family protein [Sediminitomix flava]PWJ39283.1 hypothetical protein BC781_106184 [Sediminitomix flava]